MKKKIKNPWLILLITLLFLILLSLSILKLKSNIITGNIIDNTPISNSVYCFDTDGGAYSKIKGTLTSSGVNYTDSCYTSTTVYENFCNLTKSAYPSRDAAYINCPAGYSCSGGACILAGSCSDTDSGTNYNIKGTVYYNRTYYNDTCISTSNLREEYCYYDRRASTIYTCQVNSWCNNGACTPLKEGCFLKLNINETKKVIAPATEGCNPYNGQSLYAFASDTSTGSSPTYAADNNPATSWKSFLSPSRHYLTIRMNPSGTLYCIRGVSITANIGSGGAANALATIEVSDDGVTWSSVGQQWLTYTSTNFVKEFTQTNKAFIRIYADTQLIVTEIAPVGGIVNPEQSVINFSLMKAENIFGDYNHLVDKYYSDDGASYILKTFDSLGKLLNNYSLYSSRFIIAEDFSETEPKGEIIESPNGVIETIIPFDPKMRTIKVDNEGNIIDIRINISSLSCKRTCKVENEVGFFANEVCCSGFTQIQYQTDTTRFICTSCGNKICSGYENKYNCPEDCVK